MTRRLKKPWTEFQKSSYYRSGDGILQLHNFIAVIYGNPPPGFIERLKFRPEGVPDYSNPYRIWFLSTEQGYMFFDTEKEAQAMRVLRSLKDPEIQVAPPVNEDDERNWGRY